MSDTTVPSPTSGGDAERALLRHVVATLAYRTAKVLRDAPESFATFALTPHAREPVRIVAHITDLLEWGIWLARGEYVWAGHDVGAWEEEVRRCFDALGRLDAQLASEAPLGHPAGMIFQGPLADALTHVGQLAMLRGAAGVPIRPESYARAEIVPGRVTLDQAPPRREFEGDASARRPE